MTTKTFMTICAAAMLAACSGHCDRHHGCDGQCAPADSMNIVLDLHRHVKPQYVAAFKAAFIECKQQTVKEPGCLDYGVYQAADDSTHLFIGRTGQARTDRSPEEIRGNDEGHVRKQEGPPHNGLSESAGKIAAANGAKHADISRHKRRIHTPTATPQHHNDTQTGRVLFF